jgi:hypothetical protein
METTGIIEKIRALRALATSANMHEAQAAAAQAARLAEKYRIDEAELLLAGEAVEEPMHVDPEPIVAWARTVYWQARLASVLGKHHGCAVYRETKYHYAARRTKEFRIRAVGRPSDIALVRYFYGWLSVEIVRLADKACKGMGRSYRASWCAGAVRGIDEQLTAASRQVREQAHASSSALVLVGDRHKVADKFMRGLMKLRSGSWGGRLSDGDAYRAGIERGKQINLGGALPAAHRALPARSGT